MSVKNWKVSSDYVKAVLFDVDGVLLDSDEKILDNYEKVGKILGLKSPGRDFFRKRFGIHNSIVIAEAYGDTLEGVKLFQKLEAEMKVGLMNGTKEFLQKIKIKKGIVSTKMDKLIKKFLYEIIDEFDVVVGYEDTEKHKPNPDPLLLACKRLDANPKDVVYIGDAIADWEMVRSAGTQFIGFVSGASSEDEFREAGVKTIVHSMKELSHVIQKLV